MANNKPIGTFYCPACREFYDGNQLFLDPTRIAWAWTCGYLMCGATVVKESNLPKDQWERALVQEFNKWIENLKARLDEPCA